MVNPQDLGPWEVKDFSVEAGLNGIHDELFANGLMQVPVTITLTAFQPNDNGDDVEYILQPNDLMSLAMQLSGGRPLPSEWKYSWKENEFAHVMPSRREAQQSAAPQDNQDKSHNRASKFPAWITTTKVETQNIIAGIKQGNGEWVTTEDHAFNSYVQITGRPPVDYTPNYLNIERANASGYWYIRYLDTGDSGGAPWHQTNYYVSPASFPMQKATVHWNGVAAGQERAFSVVQDPSRSHMAYAWYLDDPTRQRVGYTQHEANIDFELIADVDVNEGGKAPCFTLMRYEYTSGITPGTWRGDAWFEFWDIYGNVGKLYPKVTPDGEEIEFHPHS